MERPQRSSLCPKQVRIICNIINLSFNLIYIAMNNVICSASFVLEKIVPNSEINLPAVDFKTMPLTSDISYQRPKSNYANNAAADLTQGRHVVQQSLLITKVKKMLGEAADYLEENHLDTKEPDFKHGHTINRILYNMGYMEVASLEEVFSAITFTSTQRDIIIK